MRHALDFGHHPAGFVEKTMNHRQRFSAILRCQPRDRVAMFDLGYWDETIDAWHTQGLPAAVNKANIYKFFGLDFNLSVVTYDFDSVTYAIGTEMGLYPRFEEIIIEDRKDEQIVQQNDGVRVLRKKIPPDHPAARRPPARRPRQLAKTLQAAPRPRAPRTPACRPGYDGRGASQT